MNIELDLSDIVLLVSILEEHIDVIARFNEGGKHQKIADELQDYNHALFIALLAQSGVSTKAQIRYDKQFKTKLGNWRRPARKNGVPPTSGLD